MPVEEKMRALVFILLSIATMTQIGCTVVQVSQDYDPDGAFQNLGAWQWRNPVQSATGDLRVDNPLLDRRIRRAVENHLAGRNIRLDREHPDFHLVYHLAIQPKIRSDSYYSTMGVGGFYYPWYGGVDTETRIYQFDESQLTIDIHAVDTGDLLWRGVGIYRFKRYKTPEVAAEDVQKTVDKILSQFPPGAEVHRKK